MMLYKIISLTLRIQTNFLMQEVGKENDDFVVAHTMRVVDISNQLRLILGGDRTVVISAAFFHDIEFHNGFKGHGERGARYAESYFKPFYPKSIIDQIAHSIEAHPVVNAPYPQTVEAKIIRDADRIDSISSFLPQRFLVGKKVSGSDSQAWDDCFFRIRGWYQSMVTNEGRGMFLKKLADMRQIFVELKDLEL